MLFAIGAAFGAFAQRHGHAGGYHYSRPRVVIVGVSGYSPFYPSYGFGYNPFYGYPYANMYRPRPSKLDLEIEDIKNDYQDKIWSVKHDKTISRQERKQQVHQLKHEREEAVIEAKRDYYKPEDRS